jgi:hypothetical protein
LRRSGRSEYPATSVPFSNSTDGLDAGAVAGHQFVLFEELGALMAPAALAPLPATLLPHHNGEVALPRRWKTLIFLTALLAT